MLLASLSSTAACHFDFDDFLSKSSFCCVQMLSFGTSSSFKYSIWVYIQWPTLYNYLTQSENEPHAYPVCW